MTIFPGVPAMYVAMQHLKGFDRFDRGLSRHPRHPLEGVEKVGSIGIPLPDTEACVVDMEDGTRTLPPGEEGELVIRGPQVMRGYWNQPEETRAAIRTGGCIPATWRGWTRTGTFSSWTARRTW